MYDFTANLHIPYNCKCSESWADTGEKSTNLSYAIMRTLFQLTAGLEAKQGDRVWLKNQTDGELDDAKLVEGTKIKFFT